MKTGNTTEGGIFEKKNERNFLGNRISKDMKRVKDWTKRIIVNGQNKRLINKWSEIENEIKMT